MGKAQEENNTKDCGRERRTILNMGTQTADYTRITTVNDKDDKD